MLPAADRRASLKCVADLFEMLSPLLAGCLAVACDRKRDRQLSKCVTRAIYLGIAMIDIMKIGLEVVVAFRFSICWYVGIPGASSMGFDW